MSLNEFSEVEIAAEDAEIGDTVPAQAKRYQKYFQLSSTDFAKRLIRSVIPVYPLLGSEYEDYNRTPDLYGAIWVPTTLILSLSVGRSIHQFVKSLVNLQNSSLPGLDFRALGIGAGLIYGYCLLIPLSLFVVRLCSSVDVPFFATLCVYGYSLTPVVLASLACIVPLWLVQWIAMAVAFSISTVFMFFNLWREQTLRSKSVAYFVKVTSGVLHLALGVALTYIFFSRS